MLGGTIKGTKGGLVTRLGLGTSQGVNREPVCASHSWSLGPPLRMPFVALPLDSARAVLPTKDDRRMRTGAPLA